MKAKKRSLLISVISLILCFSMLVGTTFAWFTDRVVSGKNTIAAGNLDVELYHSNAAVANEQVKNDTILFKDMYGNPILWEPGVVSYENLRIANEGDLALFYQLRLDAQNENYVVYPDGTQYGLSQILQVGFVEGGITATDRADVVAAVDAANWTDLASFMRNGSLLPAGKGESEKTWGVVVYWEPGENDDLWNLNNGKQLSSGEVLSIELGVHLEASQYSSEMDSFDDQYDAKAMFPLLELPVTGAVTVAPTDEGKVPAGGVQIQAKNVTVTVQEGTQLLPGATELTLRITNVDETASNVVIGETEVMRSLDVHVEGVAEDNTVPLLVTMPKALAPGLNMGNYKVFHVEDGVTNVMSAVSDLAELNAHNLFYYDVATGDVTLCMASFSEVVTVTDYLNPWKGGVDFSWYNPTAEKLYIANGDQLWAFSQIVGGMAYDEDGKEIVAQDDFNGKFVFLTSDINLGDAEENNVEDKIFYPIGCYNNTKSYTKFAGKFGEEAVYSNASSFEGTFDGQGHTIADFYQNTWEMFGDYNDGYSGTPNHYKDAMGLFGYVYGGTVKNLTVENFSSDGEFTPTGVIAAYACNATFENIALVNCNPRVYNTGNGGIVGIGGNSSDPDTYNLTFNNITIDNTNKITALWGSWDVACGGLVGMFRGAGHVYMNNCHVGAQIDVFNDVCGNYQYYWYRYAGMLVGTNQNMITEDGRTKPETSKYHATDCTVHFGNWNDYYYCELVENSLASYTHDHQMSRLDRIQSISEIKNKNGEWIKTGNFILMNGNTPVGECYHIRKDANGNLYQHMHADKGTEVVNNKTVLVEDKQIVYLPFNQLFTGYGWGVEHVPIYDDGTPNPFKGVTVLSRESVKKFAPQSKFNYIIRNKVVRVGDIFAKVNQNVEPIVDENVMVSVTDITDTGVIATYTKGTPWTNGTLTFNKDKVTGMVKITIQDYDRCEPTSVYVTLELDEQTQEEYRAAGNAVYDKAVEMTVNGVFTGSGVNVECPHCNAVVQWYDLNTNIDESGKVNGAYDHYYLSADLTNTDKEVVFEDSNDIKRFCLHLNGHDIVNDGTTLAAVRVPFGSTLAIMGEGEVKGPGSSEGSSSAGYPGAAVDNRSILYLYGGTYSRTTNKRPVVGMFGDEGAHLVHMFNGTIIDGETEEDSSFATVRVDFASNVFNMFGGTIKNGKAQNTGGNVFVDEGTFNMYDGVISNGVNTGTSSSNDGGNVRVNLGTFNMSGGTLTGGVSKSGYGGNLYVLAGTANIGGDAKIEHGKATRGGNFALGSNGVINMIGGTVQHGRGENLGGNIYVVGKFNMSGGLVKGGWVTNPKQVIDGVVTGGSGGSIGIVEGTVNISGGTVDGDMTGANTEQAYNACFGGLLCIARGSLTVSGDALLKNGTVEGDGLTSAIHAKITEDSHANNINLYFYGGTIEGQVRVANGSASLTKKLNVYMKGNPKIGFFDAERGRGDGLVLCTDRYITITGELDGATVYVRKDTAEKADNIVAKRGTNAPSDISGYAEKNILSGRPNSYNVVADGNTLIFQNVGAETPDPSVPETSDPA